MSDKHDAFDPRKMDALVQIARGLAPPLSDLLTVIRGQAGLLLQAERGETGGPAPVNQIYLAAEKAGSLLRQLLIFSQQQPMHGAPLDLNSCLRESGDVLGRLLGGRIAIEFRLAPELPAIVADADMIEQVLLILAQNAREAMPAGGRLTLSTEVVVAAADPARSGSGGAPEQVVLLQVDDTGPGIDPNVRDRLFEPFFTTKTAGRHLGLGLATVRGIVRQHQGWVEVGRTAGGGASFRLHWPLAPAGTTVPLVRGPKAGEVAGRETILFVEDDTAVRDFLVAVLQREGYRVLQAASGADALEAWQWHRSRVRLLLTDMVLGDDLSGMELAVRLRAEDPAIGVICTSGHSRETMKRLPELPGGWHFLQKPCRLETLLAAVRATLDRRPRLTPPPPASAAPAPTGAHLPNFP